MRLSLIIAAAAVGIACVSCGSKKKEQVDIKGMWSIEDNDINGGYIFGEDGLADVYIYPPEAYLNDNGLSFGGNYIPEKDIEFDGDILSMKHQDEDYLTADRIGGPDKESYDGEYELVSGTLRDAILGTLGVSDSENSDIRLSIEDERIRVTLREAVEYSFDGERLELKGRNGMPDSSGDAELSGDKITVERSDGGSRVLKRVAEEQK